MKTVETFGVLVLPVGAFSSSSSSPSSAPSPTSTSTGLTTSLLPCPGLTEKDGASLSQYFSWTCSEHWWQGSSLCSKITLLGRIQKPLLREEGPCVAEAEAHTHMVCWPYYEDHPCNWKVTCEGNADIASDGSVRVYKVCQSLLTSQTFKKAISRKPAPNMNHAYIPQIYQTAIIGKMYSLGFNDLIDGVSTRLNFWTCRRLISMLDI